MSAPAPDLLTSGDPAELLSSWYGWRKAQDPSFSVRAFADRVGEKNRTILHSVLKGDRRLTVEQALRWLPALELREAEAALLLALVRVEEARAERRRIEARRGEGALLALATEQVTRREAELASLRPGHDSALTQEVSDLIWQINDIEVFNHNIIIESNEQRRTILARLADTESAARPMLFGLTEAVNPEVVAALLAELRQARDGLLAATEPGPPCAVHLSLFPLSRPLDGLAIAPDPLPVASQGEERAPSVLAFTDTGGGAVAFLAAWLAWRQRSDSRYSTARFARDCGQTDRAILWKILHHKQRLTPLRALTFARGDGSAQRPGMGLDPDEAEVLALLAARDLAEDPAERALYQGRIDPLRALASAEVLSARRARLLAGWAPFAIHELALCLGFQADPEWISAALHGQISPTEAATALSMLSAAHMLESLPEGLRPAVKRWQLDRPAHASTPEAALLRYHQAMADQEQRAIRQRLSGVEHGPFYCARLRIPCSAVEIFRRLESLFGRLQGHCATPSPRTQVVQIILHSYPETR